MTGQKVTLIGVNAIGFRLSFFCLIIVNGHQLFARFWRKLIVVARNAWVCDFVRLCVMENRSCAKQWMVEGVIALKEICGMDGRK